MVVLVGYAGTERIPAGKSLGDLGALVEDLVKALDMFKVPVQEKGELLGLLGPMKKGIKDHEAMGADRSVPARFYTEEARWCDGW